MTKADDLRDKLDAEVKDLSGKLQEIDKTWRDKLEASVAELKNSARETENALHAELKKTAETLGEIQGTLKSAKLAVVIAGVVSLAFAYLGIDIKKDSAELKSELEKSRVITKKTAALAQSSLVNALENEFEKEDSLDALAYNSMALRQIKEFTNDIIEGNDRLEKKSTYFNVGLALDSYLKRECNEVLTILDRVAAEDRNRFTYHYMRGACLLELKRSKDAESEFAAAEKLSGTKRGAMSLNARAVAKLDKGRAEKNGRDVDDAIAMFQSLIKNSPNFPPGYMNLACAYAVKEEYEKTTEYLRKPVQIGIRSSDAVVARIEEDLMKPNHQYLEGYVRYLKISVPYGDPQWRPLMYKAIRF